MNIRNTAFSLASDLVQAKNKNKTKIKIPLESQAMINNLKFFFYHKHSLCPKPALPTEPGGPPPGEWAEPPRRSGPLSACPSHRSGWSRWRRSAPDIWPCTAGGAQGHATSSSAWCWARGSRAPSSGARAGCGPGSPAPGFCESRPPCKAHAAANFSSSKQNWGN